MKKSIFFIICILLTSASAVFAQDTDGDGLEDAIELIYGTDTGDGDTDNDGLSDGYEDTNLNGSLNIGETSPLDADTDDDGISDGDEADYSLNPLDSDTDDDDLNDGLEIGRSTPVPAGVSDYSGKPYLGTAGSWFGDSDPASKTDPLDTDSDNDGINDGDEDKNHDGVKDATECNPVDADTDDDCLKDGDEDQDYDGVLDATETDPKDIDTDNDALTDGLEKGRTTPVPAGISGGSYAGNRVAFLGTAAGYTVDADPASVTDPRDADTDNDGFTDGTEDADHDGLVDASESDPNDSDTDDDGSSDGADCNNVDPSIYPGAVEIPGDGVDQDCDGLELCYRDTDYDGFRPDASSTVISADCDCLDAGEATAAEPSGDCNDANASVHPGAAEIPADGVDQDCNGEELCYKDADDDGYRPDVSSTVVSADCDCDDSGEAAAADPSGDCNDSDESFYPGAPESCDEGDKNCDGNVRSSSSESITESACFSYTAPDGVVYTTSGIKVAVVPNADGCDHTITIDLTIKDVDVSVTQDLATLTANATPAEYQWLDCDDGCSPIDGETSQIFTPSTSGNYAVKVTRDGCEAVSLCYPVVATAIVAENSLTKNLRVWPNPTSGLVYIDPGESISEIKVVISDVNGKIISNTIFRDSQVISTYIEGAPGIYNILIIANDKGANIKLLKN